MEELKDLKVLISEEELHKRIKELAKQIARIDESKNRK